MKAMKPATPVEFLDALGLLIVIAGMSFAFCIDDGDAGFLFCLLGGAVILISEALMDWSRKWTRSHTQPS